MTLLERKETKTLESIKIRCNNCRKDDNDWIDELFMNQHADVFVHPQPQDVISWLETPLFTANHAYAYMAIAALQKQIPKQVLDIQGTPTWGRCPSCGEIVRKSHDTKGCGNCLQALNWDKEKNV